MTGERRQAVRPIAATTPGPEDRRDGLVGQLAWRSMRPRAPIEQAFLALRLEPAHHL